MKKSIWILCAVSWTGICTVADEVEELVKQLQPPARFGDHRPEFRVSKQTFSFEHTAGPEEMDFYIIKDRARHVALIPLSGFHSGTIYVLDFNPTKAPLALRMPTERWHIDTAIGTELQTQAFIPSDYGATEASYEFGIGRGTLTLTRRFIGEASFDRWAHRDKQSQRVALTNQFTLRCDPVHGYIVEGIYDVHAERFPAKYQFTSHAQSGRYSLWPETETCYRTVVCPIGKDGYTGYYLNLPCIASGRLSCRDGGFVGFLNDQTGWSTVTTTMGGNAPIGVCNVHADLDMTTVIPKDLPTGPDGLKHWVQRHRLLALPPELTKYVWERMEVQFEGQHRVQIRVGTLEDFEDQPLPMTTRVRGLSWTSNDPKISREVARSSRRSMVVSGIAWPNLPQIVLKPDTNYRLEAWVKVKNWTDEQRQAAEAKARANIEKQRNKGREVADFAGLEPPAAFMTGHLYEWTPHSGEWLVRQETNHATPGSSDWQRVRLDFHSPKWGPFINVVFQARNCTAWFDDFQLVELK